MFEPTLMMLIALHIGGTTDNACIGRFKFVLNGFFLKKDYEHNSFRNRYPHTYEALKEKYDA